MKPRINSMQRLGRVALSKAIDPVSRFWAQVDKTDSCWNWTGRLDGVGYGQMNVNGKRVGVHRYSYFLANGVWPQDFVCHHCDNRVCVRPNHLFHGTARDNARDCVNKGRAGGGSLRGVNHPQAKMNDEIVKSIWRLYADGRALRKGGRGANRQIDIAAELNITRSAVSNVLRGKTWVHVIR